MWGVQSKIPGTVFTLDHIYRIFPHPKRCDLLYIPGPMYVCMYLPSWPGTTTPTHTKSFFFF